MAAHALTGGEHEGGSPVAALEGEASRALLHPLAPGDRVGRWTLVSAQPSTDGAMAVALRSDDAPEHVFFLDVMAKDASALAARPPAETKYFSVFVRNGGDGWLPTEEDQGLAAMTLGALIERNERSSDAAGFRTHAARLGRAPER